MRSFRVLLRLLAYLVEYVYVYMYKLHVHLYVYQYIHGNHIRVHVILKSSKIEQVCICCLSVLLRLLANLIEYMYMHIYKLYIYLYVLAHTSTYTCMNLYKAYISTQDM